MAWVKYDLSPSPLPHDDYSVGVSPDGLYAAWGANASSGILLAVFRRDPSGLTQLVTKTEADDLYGPQGVAWATINGEDYVIVSNNRTTAQVPPYPLRFFRFDRVAETLTPFEVVYPSGSGQRFGGKWWDGYYFAATSGTAGQSLYKYVGPNDFLKIDTVLGSGVNIGGIAGSCIYPTDRQSLWAISSTGRVFRLDKSGDVFTSHEITANLPGFAIVSNLQNDLCWDPTGQYLLIRGGSTMYLYAWDGSVFTQETLPTFTATRGFIGSPDGNGFYIFSGVNNDVAGPTLHLTKSGGTWSTTQVDPAMTTWYDARDAEISDDGRFITVGTAYAAQAFYDEPDFTEARFYVDIPLMSVQADGNVDVSAEIAATVPFMSVSIEGNADTGSYLSVQIPLQNVTIQAAVIEPEPPSDMIADLQHKYVLLNGEKVAYSVEDPGNIAYGQVVIPLLQADLSGFQKGEAGLHVFLPIVRPSILAGIVPDMEVSVTLPLQSYEINAQTSLTGELGVTLGLSVSIDAFTDTAPRSAELPIEIPLLGVQIMGGQPLDAELAVTIPFYSEVEGNYAFVEPVLPMLQVSLLGPDPVSGELAAMLPMQRVNILAGLPADTEIDVVIPLANFSINGEVTIAGDLDATVPLMKVEIKGPIPADADLDILMPLLTIDIQGQRSEGAWLGVNIPMLQVSGEVIRNPRADISVRIPIQQFSISGELRVDATLAVEIPLLNVRILEEELKRRRRRVHTNVSG